MILFSFTNHTETLSCKVEKLSLLH